MWETISLVILAIGNHLFVCYSNRYLDDGFLSWNKSEQELCTLLKEANTWHPNIKLDYQIRQRLAFLDDFLTHQNGILSFPTFQQPSTEPFIAPFLFDHPRCILGNIFQGALKRTVRCSSTYGASYLYIPSNTD